MRTKFNVILTLFLAFTVQLTFAQQKTVTGTVSDEQGLPLPGVNVLIKGTSSGTQTDFDGNYTINVAQGQTLSFSYVGFTSKEKEVGASNTIDVTMETSSSELAEVVIVGAMGIKRTADAVTSAQQQVTSEELNRGNNQNAIEALNGKVSGLVITNTNSGVNDENTIQLRGTRSITGNNEALIVIDNVISDAATFSTLPPEIIESVNVIKGAQGAALYGSSGVNGAIIVTTRKGSESGLQIEYNGSLEFESTAFVPKRQNRYGQGWYNSRDQYENGAWGPAFDGSKTAIGLPMYDYNGDGAITLDGLGWGSGTPETGDNPAAMVGPYEAGKNYVKDFFDTGAIINNGITLNAGNEDQYALLNINRSSKDFIIGGDTRKKTSVLLKAGSTIENFTVSGSVNYIRTDTHLSPVMFDESAQQDPIYWHLLQAAPGVPVTKYKEYPDNAYAWNAYYQNPYWRTKHVRENRQNNLFSLTGNLAYEFNKNINVRYTGNLRTRNTDSQSHRDAFSTDIYDGPGAAAISGISSAYFLDKRASWDYYGDLLFNFDYDLSDDFNFKANVGHSYQEHRYSLMENGGTNLEVDGVYNMSNVTQPLPASDLANNFYRRNLNAVFANIDLAFKDYLFLNLTGRNEWSSTLSNDNNSYFYPSAGLSFIPTKAWDIEGDVLSYLKIAGSWTKVGNSSSVDWYDINPNTILGSGYPFDGHNSYRDNMSPADPQIKPEFVTTSEVNLDVGLFHDRVVLNGAIYQEDTKDMITQQSVSSASGLSSQLINIGKMRGRGAEINLKLTPVRTSDWKWDIRVGYSYNESIVKKVSDDADEVALGSLGSLFGVYAQKGSSFPLLKSSMMKRNDQGSIIIDPSTGNPEITSKLFNVGVGVPKNIYNFNTSISYKGLTLAATADLRLGSKFFAYVKNGMAFNGTLLESGQLDREQGGFVMENSVIPDGKGGYVENTDVKTGGNDYNAVNDYYSSFYGDVGENYLTDGWALKVRELSLSYDLPKDIVSKVNLRGVSFGVHARNPFRKFASNNQNFADPETSYLSPESSYLSGSAKTSAYPSANGIAYPGQYPSTKVYGFSLNIKY